MIDWNIVFGGWWWRIPWGWIMAVWTFITTGETPRERREYMQ